MIVKSVKAIGAMAGKALDEEDRQALGQGIVLLAAVAIVIVTAAGSAGLAWRLFQIASGI